MTKQQLVSVISSLGVMEINNRELRSIAFHLGPANAGTIRGLAKGNELEIKAIKTIVMKALAEKVNVAEPEVK